MESRHLQREEQLERKVEAQEEKERELAAKETGVEQGRMEAEELKGPSSQSLEKWRVLGRRGTRTSSKTRRGRGCPRSF
ncbi:MAG: hypothetical protein Ct9H300mP11_31770 [Chloroflexota bacterium]|nr:MAG: hypothetical protein Ct9H300mP11_31770 [Chloroflexota bacterium]